MKTTQPALLAQKLEITEHYIYLKLAERAKDPRNAGLLRQIAAQELEHARFWETKTGIRVKPDRWRIRKTTFLARLLGMTFVLKQMEKREGTGSARYESLHEMFPEARQLAMEEKAHEQEILGMLNEEKLQYVGSIVLGLNDALVELTGALAGFTLTLGDTRIISVAGLVTGISAAFSMAASDYLSSRAEGNTAAKKSALYTGISYFFTVILLILPFLLIPGKFAALGLTLLIAILIIFCFNYYLATAKDLNFKSRFLEMAGISLGVAAFSFLVGYLLNLVLPGA